MSLKDQALSCTFTSRFCKFIRLDKVIAAEVEKKHDTKSGLGKYNRNLFPGCDTPLRTVLSDIEKVREVHEFYSVPWPPSRAVKTTAYPKHRDATKEAIAKFDVSLQAFHDAYPKMVEQGIANSKGLATPDEYMPQSEIFERFSVSIEYGQLTDAAEWLKTTLLTPEEAAELVAQSQEAEAKHLEGVANSIKDQLAACLKSARENLAKKYSPTDLKARFNTTWLTNLQQLASMLPAFNLMNDPTIPKILVDLAPVLKHSPETMKTSAVAQLEAHTCIEKFILTHDAWLNS